MASDFSEVERLARDLGREAVSARQVLTGLAHGAGRGMKSQMRRDASGVQDGRIASTIDYAVRQTPTGFEVEAGPRRGGAGSLAFFYFGNSKMANPPIVDPIYTLRDEADKTGHAMVAAFGAFVRRG